MISGDADLLVDLALDSPPSLPASPSPLGPTFALEELAGRKVVALFDRAEARDFADVFALAHRYEPDLLLRRAAEVDLGFDLEIFASMLGTLDRFTDADLPVSDDDTVELRVSSSTGDASSAPPDPDPAKIRVAGVAQHGWSVATRWVGSLGTLGSLSPGITADDGRSHTINTSGRTQNPSKVWPFRMN